MTHPLAQSNGKISCNLKGPDAYCKAEFDLSAEDVIHIPHDLIKIFERVCDINHGVFVEGHSLSQGSSLRYDTSSLMKVAYNWFKVFKAFKCEGYIIPFI
jgi:hypothetical protein